MKGPVSGRSAAFVNADEQEENLMPKKPYERFQFPSSFQLRPSLGKLGAARSIAFRVYSKPQGRQEFKSGRRRCCGLRRTNNGAHRQSPAQEHGWFRHDQVRLEILSAKWRGIEVRKYEC